ncbi:hypothetical protein N4R57_02080 [Rhodobacteraceae bacterium D3-12]|nr:hypothetical protein N4R57_02080 [Rhodobacteraceae bacterium D3-12]
MTHAQHAQFGRPVFAFAPVFALVALTAFAAPLPAFAQQQGARPPAPDLSAIAGSLGVSESAIKSCMPQRTPGQRPARPDAGKIASCLKSDNPDVTKAKVDSVLKEHAPKRRKRG